MKDEDYNSYSLRKHLEAEEAYGAEQELRQQGADEKPMVDNVLSIAEEGGIHAVTDILASSDDYKGWLLTDPQRAADMAVSTFEAWAKNFDGGKA